MKIVKPLEALELLSIEAEAVLIDVRHKSEWQNGYPDISSAGKIPMLITITQDVDEFGNLLKNKVKKLSTPMLFLCYAGHRSAIAATVAEKIGYSNCYNIDGGFSEWLKLGLSFTRIGV